MPGKFALVLGNSHYTDPEFPELTSPRRDAHSLAEVLKADDIGEFQNVATLIDKSAADLRIAISRFFARRDKNDLLLLYFSGHGVLDERGKLHFVVCDTIHDALNATAISAEFIRTEMANCLSRRQILILDCCYSGAFTQGTKGTVNAAVNTAKHFDIEGYGHVVLTATDSIQRAWEGNRILGNVDDSLFTHFLVEGLQTGCADIDKDGLISLDEWYEFAFTEISKTTKRQKPQKSADHVQGKMIIAKSAREAVNVDCLPCEVIEAAHSELISERLSAVNQLSLLVISRKETIAKAARQALEALTKDDSQQISTAATAVLKLAERLKAIEDLSRLLDSDNKAIAKAARHTLESLAKDDSRQVSRAAVAALRSPIGGVETQRSIPWKWITGISLLAVLVIALLFILSRYLSNFFVLTPNLSPSSTTVAEIVPNTLPVLDTPTNIPTETASTSLSPSPTHPIPTTANPVILLSPTVLALDNINIRSGPAATFMALGSLRRNETAIILGRSIDNLWWKIECPDKIQEDNCWVTSDPRYIQAQNVNYGTIGIQSTNAPGSTLERLDEFTGDSTTQPKNPGRPIDTEGPVESPGSVESPAPIESPGSVESPAPVESPGSV